LGQALLDQDAPLGEKPHPLKDQGDGGGLLRHLYPFRGKLALAGLGDGKAGPQDLGVPGEVVGAFFFVKEEALDVQKPLLQVVLGVVEGKPPVPGQAQGEEGPLGLRLPQADPHPVGGVAEGQLGRDVFLEAG